MTLIDMSVALIVIGLLAVPLIQSYNAWKAEKINGDTFTGFLESNRAITDFYFENGRYPCPALLNTGPGDDGYGEEDCITTDADPVLIGGVPFVTLKMSESSTLDGYKNKITYAVTKTQTVTPAPNEDFPAGIIQLRQFAQPGLNQCDRDEANIDTIADDAHFILASHGPTATGGFNQRGVRQAACDATPGTPEWTRDTENCNDDEIFFMEACAASNVEGPDFFDDKLYPQVALPSRIWDYSEASANDIRSQIASIGINNPDPQWHLDVIGNVKTETRPGVADETGNANIGWVCDADGRNCFNPVSIGGVDPAMNCKTNSTNTGMTGIGRNLSNPNVIGATARCATTYTNVNTRTCPAGQYMSGITAGGEIQCTIR